MIPLPRFRHDEVQATNRIFARRAPAALPVGRDVLCAAVAPAPGAARRPVVLELEVDGRLAWLELEQALVERVTATAFPEVALDGLAPELAPVLLEAALAPQIEVLERVLTRRLQLHRLGAEVPDRGLRAIPFSLAPPEGAAPLAACLWLEPASLPLLAQLLELLPAAPVEAAELPLELACRVGCSMVTLRELEALRPADLIVVERTGVGQSVVDLVVGRALAFPAKVDHNTATITDRPRRLMAEETGPAGEPEIAGELESVPITLVFELGRVQVPLGELRTLAPGFSFDLGKDLRAPVDILANGRKIGSGELIQIDERIGVRVSQLFER
ncbi:MAG TPA: type III secretion system cytoplasmic ring protein SctQ [Geminicoccaceae bacterium]|nr:type III secretion system cytoplasmic ring protein SctQ [Geminicoccaceae bacterium]